MSARTTLPTVAPMQPTLIAKSFHREGWIYEEKVDGWRMVAYKAGAAVKLVSRQGTPRATRTSWPRSGRSRSRP